MSEIRPFSIYGHFKEKKNITLQKNVLQIQIIMHSRILMKLIEVYNCDESIVVSNKTERRIVLPIKMSGPFELL